MKCGSCTRAKHPDGFICFSKTEMSSGSELPWAGTDGQGQGRAGAPLASPKHQPGSGCSCTSSPFPGHIRAADHSLIEQTLHKSYFNLVTGGIRGVFLAGLPLFFFFFLLKKVDSNSYF